MTASAKRPATYADIEALPEDMIGEIINGRLLIRRVSEMAPSWRTRRSGSE
jgi:hypothetical protein